MMDNSENEQFIEHDNKNLCTYLLTIRRTEFDLAETEDFKEYFELLGQAGCEVLVVDGSPPKVYQAHEKIWRGVCRHASVDSQYKYLNGKVNGIHTGVALAAHNSIILADDDIRYTTENVRRITDLLKNHELVRPQNYFAPLPWWARIEAARMLINRAWIKEGDYSGTLGVTREAMLRVGHYDGDVLFDNEEIVRHFRLHGANINYARDFFVLKLPATLRKWLEQRPRQAYEDFVMSVKTAFFLLLPITFIFVYLLGDWHWVPVFTAFIVGGAMLTAICGLSDGATRFFSAWAVLYAPLWIIERTISTYWAIYWRLAYRGYPSGDKILSKGTGRAWVAGGQTKLRPAK